MASEKNTIQFNDEKNAFSINDTLSMGKNFNQDNYILPPEYRTLLCLVKDKNDANFKNIGIVVTCQSDTIVKGIADHKGFYTTKLIPKSDYNIDWNNKNVMIHYNTIIQVARILLGKRLLVSPIF